MRHTVVVCSIEVLFLSLTNMGPDLSILNTVLSQISGSPPQERRCYIQVQQAISILGFLTKNKITKKIFS